MLGSFRRFADTIVAKIFFAILVAAFGFWGIGDWVRNSGNDQAIAIVGSKDIAPDQVEELYRRQLQQTLRMSGSTESTPTMRRAVAGQALDRLIVTTALLNKASGLGLVVPDEAVRNTVFQIAAFKGSNGAFDRNNFLQLLRNNNLTEKRFLDDLRDDMAIRQLILPLRADATATSTMAAAFYRLQNEQRVAMAVNLPFAAAATPAAPTDAQLQRYYENNASRYSIPELRRIRAVVLAPETLSSEVTVTDDEIRQAYDARSAELTQPEKRSVQVLLTQSEDAAKSLAAQWAKGLDWDQIQKVAQTVGAAPVELDDAAQVEFPAPELGQAVFASQPNIVAAPVKSALGWHVLKVTKITPGVSRSLAEMTPELRKHLAEEKAVDLLYVRANKIEDALASGTTLENLPGDLGLAAVQGTLDAQGNTGDGKPAPIPGPAELRPALIQAAFQAKPGDTPHLVQAPNAKDGRQSFYAVEVTDIEPPTTRPYAQVADSVRSDWMRDAMRHNQEVAAAAILAAVKSGQSLQDAAAAQHQTVVQLPAIGRGAPPPGVTPELAGTLFRIKQGEPTMVETPDGFIVAVLAAINVPDPASDAAGVAELRDQIAKQVASDIETSLIVSVRNAANPRINSTLLNQIAQAE